MATPSIYLDYNATSPLRPEVREAILEQLSAAHNPSSVHSAGRAAKKIIEDARATIASAISCFPNEILFTGSGTEANNMVLRGFPDRSLLVSAIEHASILKPAQLLGADSLPVDAQGVLKLEMLESKLASLARPALISVMLVNNETGVIQPIADIARIAHAHGALLHVDAAQALGKIPLDCGLLGADMLTLCAHKAGGPVGVGALMLRNDIAIKPLLLGGGQELSRRAGTEPVALIAGFATLVSAVAHARESEAIAVLRDEIESAILSYAPEASIHSKGAPRVANTVSVSMPHASSETQLMHFDLAGIALSAGSACASGRIAPSHVLKAMGVSDVIAMNTIRVSLGWKTTRAECDAFLVAWKQLYDRLNAATGAAKIA